MAKAIFRSSSLLESVVEQEKCVLAFCGAVGVEAKDSFIDFTPTFKSFEERDDFKSFIKSIKKNEKVFIYDLKVLSVRVGELVKVISCLLNKNATLYICKNEVVMDKNSPISGVFSLLNEIREEGLKTKQHGMGRPKGSVSRSRFDELKPQITSLLSQRVSVSEISRRLGINRSSLKDYINSRELKTIAMSAKSKKTIFLSSDSALQKSIKCPLKNQTGGEK